jgi:hypothetical protein
VGKARSSRVRTRARDEPKAGVVHPLCIRCDEREPRPDVPSLCWTQQLDCHIKPPERPRPSDVRPDLGIGDLGEQPIEDEELQEPQDPEPSDVGSDNQDRTSEVLQMMAHGKVVRQG